jgi:peptidoglycan hydrolase-like protein with peptidoglycan-binding domain
LTSRRRLPLVVLGLLLAAGLVLAGAARGLATGNPAVVTPAATSTQQVQWDLAGLAYLSFANVDGVDGPVTQAAVKAFQTDRCLGVDGVAGAETDAELASQVMKVQAAAGASQDGAYGPNTESAVRTYQTAHGLTASGQADKATMTAMGVERAEASCAGPPASELGAAIVRIAQQENANSAHNREIGGYNCNWYTTALGLGGTGASCSNGWKTQEWCADFAKWVWIQAGANTSGTNSLAASFESYGKNHGTWHTSSPLPGDAIVFDGHVGLVVSSTASTVTYISGNTYNPSDGKDDVVRQNTVSRSASNLYGYSTPLPKA